MSTRLFPHAPARATLSIAILTICVANAHAVLVTSTTDVFEGATVTSSTGIGPTANRMFLGSTPETFNTYAFFDDDGVGSVGSVDFSTGTAVSLSGLRLFAGEDGAANSHRRAMSNFRLLADLDANSTFETVLIDQAVNIDYSTQPGNAASGNELDLTFAFAPITASSFRAEFTQGAGVSPFEGVRVVELDAIGTAVPEPRASALLGFCVLGLALASRRRSK